MERVVITGIGVVNAIGNTKEEYWDALASGKNGIGPLTYFDASEHRTQIAGEVKNFQAERYMDRRAAARLPLFIQYALAAAIMAHEDSQVWNSTKLILIVREFKLAQGSVGSGFSKTTRKLSLKRGLNA